MAEKRLTFEEVAKHSSTKDNYLVIHDNVYNVTKFAVDHPGGEELIVEMAGKDATEAFEDVKHSDDARELLASLKIGQLAPGSSKSKTVSSSKVGTKSSIGGILPILAIVGAILLYLASVYVF